MAEKITPPPPQDPVPAQNHTQVPDPANPENTIEENKKRSTSGLSWDQTEPKPGEKFNRVTEMGEAD